MDKLTCTENFLIIDDEFHEYFYNWKYIHSFSFEPNTVNQEGEYAGSNVLTLNNKEYIISVSDYDNFKNFLFPNGDK